MKLWSIVMLLAAAFIASTASANERLQGKWTIIVQGSNGPMTFPLEVRGDQVGFLGQSGKAKIGKSAYAGTIGSEVGPKGFSITVMMSGHCGDGSQGTMDVVRKGKNWRAKWSGKCKGRGFNMSSSSRMTIQASPTALASY
jgi:hypothetical protein